MAGLRAAVRMCSFPSAPASRWSISSAPLWLVPARAHSTRPRRSIFVPLRRDLHLGIWTGSFCKKKNRRSSLEAVRFPQAAYGSSWPDNHSLRTCRRPDRLHAFIDVSSGPGSRLTQGHAFPLPCWLQNAGDWHCTLLALGNTEPRTWWCRCLPCSICALCGWIKFGFPCLKSIRDGLKLISECLCADKKRTEQS